MAILDIIKYPEPSLMEKSLAVDNIDDRIKTLVSNMGETMISAPGVGLAAPQVAENIRVIVYNPKAGLEEDDDNGQSQSDLPDFKPIINPEITAASGRIVFEKEACLSVPDYSSDVKRYEHVTVKGLNLDGRALEFEAHGIQAVIMQHEIDHLDGILFIDRISVLKRNMYKKKIAKKIKEEKK